MRSRGAVAFPKVLFLRAGSPLQMSLASIPNTRIRIKNSRQRIANDDSTGVRATRATIMDSLKTDVLVVGAGPAGLTASALLARVGVNAITITKYGGTADSPRAHITNQRTVEIIRDLGAEDRLRRESMPQHLMGTQIFTTSFAGIELSRTTT
jgi:FAD binding domain